MHASPCGPVITEGRVGYTGRRVAQMFQFWVFFFPLLSQGWGAFLAIKLHQHRGWGQSFDDALETLMWRKSVPRVLLESF